MGLSGTPKHHILTSIEDKTHEKLRALLDHGIRHVIILMEPDEQDWSGKPIVSYEDKLQSIAASMGNTVTFERMTIKDTRVPSMVQMCQILDRIDQCIQDDKPVYIHCWGGRGRTGSVVGCFLARHGLASRHNVLDNIQELRKETEDHWIPSPETPQQVDLVLSWVESE